MHLVFVSLPMNGRSDKDKLLLEVNKAICNNLKALEAESRMSLVQEAVNAIMNTCDTDSIKDKAMRNAAKFVQNAIDGSYPDFEKLEQEPILDKIRSEIEQLPKTYPFVDHQDMYVKEEDVLQIIAKYMTEGRNNNGSN